jgi:hypothetical protein
MSKLFIVACKILGLFQLYWALSSLVSVATAFNMGYMTDEGKVQVSPKFYLILTIVYSILAFLFAFAMIFETETIARIVGLSKKEEMASLPPQSMLLKTGLILIGVIFLFSSIPDLVRSIADLYLFNKTNRGLSLYLDNIGNWVRPITTLCQIGLAIWIIMNPEGIIRLISWKKKKALS